MPTTDTTSMVTDTVIPTSNETVVTDIVPTNTEQDVSVTNVDIDTLPNTSVVTEVLSDTSAAPTFEPTSTVEEQLSEPTNITGSEAEQQNSNETNMFQVEENTSPIKEEINASYTEPEKINISTSSQINNDKLTQALDTIVEVLSEKVAAKVSNEIGPNLSGERIQDGFNSVAIAAEKMSGGKKNKSKKFRLTNKTKSRKQKK